MSSVPPAVSSSPDDTQLERVFGVNHLKQIAWLEQGLLAARSVCRIVLPRQRGTGFLLDGDWIVTNYHVLSQTNVDAAVIEFGFEEDIQQRMRTPDRYRLDPTTFRGDKQLDVACAKVTEDASLPPVTKWGKLSVSASVPKIDDHVSIVQHPDGGPKMIALTANQVVNTFEHRLQYLTDTLPGSSGSPVFDDQWHVVAVHHAGGNLVTSSRGTRRFVNEGVLTKFALQALGL